jgi:hypothetical protein
MSNLIQRHPFSLVVKQKIVLKNYFHSTSVQQNDKPKKWDLRFTVRWELAERLNLEHDATIISITTKYRKKPTTEGQFVFRNAIAIMFDRLSVELKTTKAVVLILLTLMAQNGGAYYHHRYFSDRFHQKFRYKEFQLSIHQALDALTEGVTDGKERSYDAFKKRSDPDLDVPRNPILQNVFVALRDDIAYVAYLGRVPGDLFPRVLKDEVISNEFVFSEEIRKDLFYFVWVSSFQMNNPNCPEEIRNWVQQNWGRFLLDPMLDFDTICDAPRTQEGPAKITYELDELDTISNTPRTQEGPAKITYELDELDTISNTPRTQEGPAQLTYELDEVVIKEVIKQQQPAQITYELDEVVIKEVIKQQQPAQITYELDELDTIDPF